MILIPRMKRNEELKKAGIPEALLENIGKIEELEFRIEGVENAYFYLPTISDYEILKNKVVVPIYDSATSIWVLLKSENESNIVYFEIEQDEVYQNYGVNWDLLLLDIMIQYFDDEIDSGLSLEKFAEVGEKIGFEKSKELFNLRNLSNEEYNLKFQDEKSWRIEIAKILEIM